MLHGFSVLCSVTQCTCLACLLKVCSVLWFMESCYSLVKLVCVKCNCTVKGRKTSSCVYLHLPMVFVYLWPWGSCLSIVAWLNHKHTPSANRYLDFISLLYLSGFIFFTLCPVALPSSLNSPFPLTYSWFPRLMLSILPVHFPLPVPPPPQQPKNRIIPS